MKETNIFFPWFYKEVSESEKQLIQEKNEAAADSKNE